MQALRQLVEHYIPLTDDEFSHLLTQFRHRTIERGEFLIQPGQMCRDFIFLKTGMVRMYALDEAKETTIWIGFAGELATELSSFFAQTPSDIYVQVLEPGEIWSISYERMERLYTEFPPWQTFARKLWEDTIRHMIDRLFSLLREPAAVRYDRILSDPDYAQVPLKYLASFLGVNPASLSRLRNPQYPGRRV